MITLKELSEFLGLSYATLRKWKCLSPHKLPPYYVVASGKKELVRFDIEEVKQWLKAKSQKRNMFISV